MANYFNFLKNMTNPFEGVMDTIIDPVDEGGINIFGAGVDKNFEAMKTAGLLTNEEYKTALNNADKQSKRNAIVQGFLGYGLQNFDKGYGSALDPRYLKAGLASAIPAAQKPFNELAPNVMNIEKLKTFKRDSNKDAKVRDILKKGFYKKTIGKDGRASFDMNYDIVNEVLKATDVPTAAAIQNIFSSKATLLNSLKTKYDIKYVGDNVFYTAKDGSGVTKVMTETGLVDAPYIGKPEDPFIANKGQLEPISLAIREQYDLQPGQSYAVSNKVLSVAEAWKKSPENRNSKVTTIDKAISLVPELYDVTKPKWWFTDTEMDIAKSQANIKPEFAVGTILEDKDGNQARIIGYDPDKQEPILEEIK